MRRWDSLVEMAEDRPWMALMKGKKVTEQWLAQQLQVYGIRPKTMRIGVERAKGYEEEDFREAFRRYIPASEIDRFMAELQARAAENNQGTKERVHSAQSIFHSPQSTKSAEAPDSNHGAV